MEVIILIIEYSLFNLVNEELDIAKIYLHDKCPFAVPTNIILCSTHYLIMKIPNKQELWQIAFNHWSDIDFQDSMNWYKKCTTKPYSFFNYWCYSCIR